MPPEKMKGRAQNIMRLIHFFFPQTHPIPWDKFLFLSFAIFIPCVIYLLFFTKIGWGLKTFNGMADTLGDQSGLFAAILVIIMFVFLLLDFPYWESPTGIMSRKVISMVSSTCFILLVLSESVQYPFGPISLFVIFIPLWLITLKIFFYADTIPLVFIQWLSLPFLFNSVLFLVGWIGWVVRDVDGTHRWNDINRLRDATSSRCKPNFMERPDCRNFQEIDDVCFKVVGRIILYPSGCDTSCSHQGSELYGSCLKPFIVWSGPLLVSISLFFFSFFCSFFQIHKISGDGNHDEDGDNKGFRGITKIDATSEGTISERELLNFSKLWFVLLCILWIAASFAGVGAGLSTALGALTLAGFIGSMIFLSIVLSRAEQKQHAKTMLESFKKKYGAFLVVIKGAFVLFCIPLVIIMILSSVFVQMVRKCGVFPGSRRLGRRTDDETEEEIEFRSKDWVTEEARKRIEIFRSWDRTKVYTWAVYCGIFYMVLSVIMTRLMYVFFAWLMDATQSWSLFAVTILMVAVGMLLFLLPPVPGLPIYLAMGVVVIAIGGRTFGTSATGMVVSVLYGIVVALLIKLLGCTVQQKVIGGALSNSIGTRRFVRINSEVIRAMRIILREPGLNLPKVGILVGGPDWPTSVLCGIMRLNLLPILFGTLPIIIMVIPTVLVGSFMYMDGLKTPSDDEIEDALWSEVRQRQKYPWAGTATTIVVALSVMVQSFFSITAVYYIEQVVTTRKDEIDAIPIDEEVLEADTKADFAAKIYSEVTQWQVLPFLAKFTLTLSVASMISCCYTAAIFSSQCFREFDITSSIEKELDGDWTNIFTPLGGAVMVIFMISFILLAAFQLWAGSIARETARRLEATHLESQCIPQRPIDQHPKQFLWKE